MINESDKQDKSTNLAKAIEDVEDFFLRENEGELYKFLLDIFEKPLIEKVLYKTEGNQLKAARILGINRNTLHSKIKKLKIDVRDFKYLQNREGGVR
ncbi:MAG: hypothetical protein KKD11_05405 [Candidatus Omnitrophica bacterium]|nr:hypothetical protein [Candidatus Omnitrophota bacterium]